MELEEYYTLDDALKLYSLWRMTQDIEAVHAEDIKKKSNRNKGWGR